MIWLCVLLISAQFVQIHSECELKQEQLIGRALVLQPIYEDYVITTNIVDSVNIPNDSKVLLFCESEFKGKTNYPPPPPPRHAQDFSRFYGSYDKDSIDEQEKEEVDTHITSATFGNLLSLRCRSNSIYFLPEDRHHRRELSSDFSLVCNDFKLSFYSTKLDGCMYSGLQYGIEVHETPIVLAEFCYNFNTSSVVFVHYFSAKRPRLLVEQMNFNPSIVNRHDLSKKVKISLPHDIFYQEVILQNKWKTFTPVYKNLIGHLMFEFDELVPIKLYGSFLTSFIGDMSSSNTIAWWMPLKTGNWEIFQNTIIRESSSKKFEIYAGTSHVALYPDYIVCNSNREISFELNGEERYVPLYIWNYIIPKNDRKMEKDFVLIAVNTPFINNNGNNETFVICEDICDEIEWLEPLKLTRKNYAFGYIFCCRPEEVSNVLFGVPQRSKV